jgi:transcriptional regulator of aromatic amino acid metabolism
MSTSGQTLACLPSVCLEEPEHESACADLVGDGAAMRRLRLQIERIGPHFRTVLVRGEMGTGKELVARALHERSGRASDPFVVCHAASLDVSAEGEDRDLTRGQTRFAMQGRCSSMAPKSCRWPGSDGCFACWNRRWARG